ncbi:hypothetical protein NO932_16565 [Pelagibacterium sp. 26DY04]|uniref:Uncharacterized protein n=1 Tax=Pelagibacterium halotolerans (strain DSM 22347 / JCM 15775 / CGMCC 1.7692 / B2) TaxID=1082931 RepID=G4RDR7_PELHB|nr:MULTISPECIES: hypothetical protein [Pelagibacterium]AEQ52853.1 hypothetical protein KKY_2847 [Pelagibacterium halotolerans B2]QJR17467.1 hypothetical protein HKM20_02805 [Pelagibacterium halotolerans]WMT86505.1 hypothetical protein NO932_16565 [Pelagibacterium sp. 26DY04]SEA74740.1 hypothetical protein SAMN05428936_107111 [Pelagibacterium halotolerans]
MRNETHEQFEAIAARAGWDSFTLLVLIARWAEDNGQFQPLIDYLDGLADEEEDDG